MKTVVLGKKIKNIYELNKNQKQIIGDSGEPQTVYIGKPFIKVKKETSEYVELCRFKGKPRYNKPRNLFSYSHRINISKDETILIEEEIFRADLNVLELYTDKVVETIDENKTEAESELEQEVKSFNRTMIESNNKLKSYCDIHKLSYEDTDCFELFQLVYPGNAYIIEKGIMIGFSIDAISTSPDGYIIKVDTVADNKVSSAITTTHTIDSASITAVSSNSYTITTT